MEIETKKFQVGDIWLCSYEYGNKLEEYTIIKIRNGYIKDNYSWEPIEVWNKRAKIKVGKIGIIKKLLYKIFYGN